LYPDEAQVLHSLPTKMSADCRPQEDGAAVAMGKSASERAVIARAATVRLLKFPLLKPQPVSHTSGATAQHLRLISDIPTGEQL
jgi:hypothetical protein